MSKYEIATFIVCSAEGFGCYLIGYVVGIKHGKRTITHECVKDTHDKTEPQVIVCPIQEEDAEYARWLYEGEPQTVDTLAIDMAVAKCKARHNNCKNCDKKCIWRGEPQIDDLIKQADSLIEFEKELLKTEPQTDIEIARAIVHKAIDDAAIAEDAYPDLRQKMHDAVDNYEPQTDCAWKKGE